MDNKKFKRLERALGRIHDDELLDALLDAPRDSQLNLRVSTAQRDQIKAIAESFDLTVSGYLLGLHTLALPRLKAALKRRKT